MTSKVLLIDIETAPALGYVWGKWQQDVIQFERPWFILCYAYKWLDEKTIKSVALPDFPGYKKNRHDDKKLVESLHKLLEQADVVIAHNGDAFDIKKINSRLLVHKLPPPKPFATVDTLKILRRRFGFLSNRLNDIGIDLGVGKKAPISGFNTWKGAMDGDLVSWRTMRDYNKQDIVLLERVYKEIRPWALPSQHINLNLLSGHDNCPACQSTKLQARGTYTTISAKHQRFQCTDCGKWSSQKISKNKTTSVKAL